MSATTSLPEVQPRRSSLVKVLIVAAIVLVLAIAGGTAWLYSIGRSALPQLDGKVVVAGVSGPVRVVRDGHGVPTIEATSPDDLFFAQGYVTAQDRLWQMDAMRRAAAGELSEILGPSLLTMDREQRILGLRAASEQAEKNMSARDREYFEAYARGVNAFMESHRARLSLEFRLLKYQPRPWTVTDSLLVGARMVQDLNHYSYARALTREKILAKIGPELTADLYVNASWRDRPPMATRPRVDEGDSPVSGDDEDDDEGEPVGEGTSLISRSSLEAFAREEQDSFRAGSNNWVVSGAHTVTGKPLLSNDMHLDHQMPNLWFAAHLKSANYEVAGVTLPGMPFVIVGHNQRIGWGFTNVGPTVEDVYVEEFNEKGQYKTPAGWRDAQHRQEVIHVKGQPDVTLDVVATRHGPIISELAGDSRRIALRWTLYDGVTLPFFDVNSAQNWEEFRNAFSNFMAPGQNVMYADVDGHIGYQATGKVPIRATGDGSLPVSGADDAHEWKGYIPFDEMPRVYDPESGILATANGRITPDGYKYSISTEWEAPWRTDRIYRVLESGKKFGPHDMLALQMDVSSTFDRFVADKFVYALDHAGNVSDKAKKAADILRDWDGRMSADSAAPTIETKARQELVRMLLEPKLGPADDKNPGALSWKSYRWTMNTVWLENVLSRQPTRWLPPGKSKFQDVFVAAIENALKQSGVPADVSQWKWGKVYPVEIEHPVLSHLPVIGRFTGPGLHPLSGSSYTVKAVGRGFGPSERVTWNFADFDKSTLNLVTGESGIFLSHYYMDQWPAWYGGSTFSLPFSPSAVEEHKRHEMVMVGK